MIVAVTGGGAAGSRVEVVVVLLALLSIERGGERLGVGGVSGVVQLLPTSVLLLIPTRVVARPLLLLLPIAGAEQGPTTGAGVPCKRGSRKERGEQLVLVGGLALESLCAGAQLGGVGLGVCEARAEGGGLVPGGGGAMAREDRGGVVAPGRWRRRPRGGARGAAAAGPRSAGGGASATLANRRPPELESSLCTAARDGWGGTQGRSGTRGVMDQGRGQESRRMGERRSLTAGVTAWEIGR